MEILILDMLERLFAHKSIPDSVRSYEKGSNKYYSPTGILSMMQDMNNIPEEYFEAGRAFHQLIEQAFKNDFKVRVPQEYQEYIYFLAKIKKIYPNIDVEKTIYSDKYKVAGTCDLVIHTKGNSIMVWDHKTCSDVNKIPYPIILKYILQLQMYTMLFERSAEYDLTYTIAFVDKRGEYILIDKQFVHNCIDHTYVNFLILTAIQYIGFLSGNPVDKNYIKTIYPGTINKVSNMFPEKFKAACGL